MTSWPDLDTNSLTRLNESLENVNEWMHGKGAGVESDRPLVILGTNASEDEKLEAILAFMSENNYEQAFENSAFAVYE